MVIEDMHAVTEDSRNLTIDHITLHRWVREHGEKDENTFRGQGQLFPEDGEFLRLKKEPKVINEEHELLKRSPAKRGRLFTMAMARTSLFGNMKCFI